MAKVKGRKSTRYLAIETSALPWKAEAVSSPLLTRSRLCLIRLQQSSTDSLSLGVLLQ